MTDTPKWHGWATPEQVRQMMQEMLIWLTKVEPLKYEWKECGYKLKDGKWEYYGG